MSALWGLPDFGAPVGAPELTAFLPYEGGAVVLLPDGLDVATRPDGRLWFTLSIVRAAPTHPEDAYAGLELGLDRSTRPDDALVAARAIDRSATLTPAEFSTGWVRMVPGSSTVKLPDDLTRPTALGWGGLGAARWGARLALESGELVEGALTGQSLLISARAEVEVIGVAPRLPVTVHFNPKELIAAVLAGASGRQIGYEDLVLFFMRTPPPACELTPALAPAQSAAFAQAMAGRVRARFGKFVPSPSAIGPAFLELTDQLDDGRYAWDLGQPEAVPRPWVFTLDPLDAARKLCAQGKQSELIVEQTIETLAFGYWRIAVSSDLPTARQDIYELDVEFDVAARPLRGAITKTLTLTEPTDSGEVQLKLAPGEKLQYTYRGFAVVRQNDSYKQIYGDPKPCNSTVLTVNAGDFPFAFLVFDADAAILSLATINGTLQYQDGDRAVTATFALSAAQPRVTLPLPASATGATVAAQVAPLAAGPAPLTFGPEPAASHHFSLATFSQYGPHTVDLQCRFAGATGQAEFELLADGLPETQQNLGGYFFTPAQSTAQFSYTAPSPFQYGYRWRLRGGDWSALQYPGAPLVLDGDAPAPKEQAMVDELDDLHVYAGDDDPTAIYYVPGAPTPELDPNGRPTLLVIASGAGGLLQLGARWAATDVQMLSLQSDLQTKHPNLSTVTLHPAPVQVNSVVVSIGDGAGQWTALSTSSSSGLPPYSAIFNVALNQAQLTQAVAAVNGRKDCLRVEYQVALPPRVAATFPGAPATLSRATDVSGWFPGQSGKDHVRVTGTLKA